MEQVMPDFITYLTNERNASKSTVSSYCRDLERMFQFLDGKGIKKTDDVTPISLNSYILYLEKEGFSISTVSRNVASMKAYFHYAFGRRLIEKDPTRTIKAPHIEKRVPGVLTQEQVTRFLEQPSRNTAKASVTSDAGAFICNRNAGVGADRSADGRCQFQPGVCCLP